MSSEGPLICKAFFKTEGLIERTQHTIAPPTGCTKMCHYNTTQFMLNLTCLSINNRVSRELSKIWNPTTLGETIDSTWEQCHIYLLTSQKSVAASAMNLYMRESIRQNWGILRLAILHICKNIRDQAHCLHKKNIAFFILMKKFVLRFHVHFLWCEEEEGACLMLRGEEEGVRCP